MRNALLASLLLLAACGGSVGGSDDAGPLSPEAIQDICDQVCVRDVMCDPTVTQEACVTECTSSVPPTLREDVYTDAADCVAALPCDADENTCLACEPTDAHRAYETRCREALPACGLTPEELDGVCSVTFDPASEGGFLCLLTSDTMDQLAACFDLPTCEEQEACWSDVAASTSN
jgi:hypothetical protein